MIKQITHLAILAAAALSCSVASAQFTFINPLTDLGIPTGGSGPFSQTFDISNDLGLGSGSVLLNVSNGFTNAGSGSSAFTVSDDEETTFTLSGTTSVFAQVSHGGFLGSPGTTLLVRSLVTASGEFRVSTWSPVSMVTINLVPHQTSTPSQAAVTFSLITLVLIQATLSPTAAASCLSRLLQ